jgi:ATP-dependent DNA helicase DinG
LVFCAAAKKTNGDWEVGALRVGDGHYPLYRRFCSSGLPAAAALAPLSAFSRDALILAHSGAEWEACLPALGGAAQLWVDTRELALMVFPTAGKYHLDGLAAALALRAPRRAAAPWAAVRLTWDLFRKISAKALSFDLSILRRAAAAFRGAALGRLCELAEREAMRLAPDRPVFTDLSFAADDEGLFAESPRTPVHLPPNWVESCFAGGELLARHMPGFEERAEQRLMARAVTRGFHKRENVVVEAGTGTGKSAAYLLPAVWRARSKECRVVVATHTITLQEQLCRKDLPFLASVLPFPFRFCLLKGRNNYCCRLRLRQRSQTDAPRPELLAWFCLLVWVRETQSGDMSELPREEIGAAWKQYNCENSSCLPRHCPERNGCYMLRARQEAEKADIIIVNHSLLLADINTENAILPEHEDLIIDEAHNFYEEAVRHLGFAFTPETLRRLLELTRGGARASVTGYFRHFAAQLIELIPEIDWQSFARQIDKLPELCRAVEQAGDSLFRLTGSLLEQKNALRLLPEKTGAAAFEAFGVETENLSGAIGDLKYTLTQMLDLLFLENQQLNELRALLARCVSELSEAAAGLASLRSSPPDWIPFLERGYTVTLRNAPINPGDILREALFRKNGCNILTSATLSVDNDFSYFADNIGLDSYTPLQLASPFDYRKQLLFCLVDDLPLYGEGETTLAEETGLYLSRVAELARGRTMVLFTSYRFLRRVALVMRTALREVRVLAQGVDGTREALLSEFRSGAPSVLLGTGSFWEGIDLIGDSLTCLVMVKLPFLVPDQPLVEARAQKLAEQGRSPFYDLMLPEAVIKFKQGFGRLIRSTEDRGVFLLLDDRAYRKSYGRVFLKSLPISTYKKGNRDGVLRAMAERLAGLPPVSLS